MKYSEFKIIAKENGWEFDMDQDFNSWAYVRKNGFEIVISQFEQNYFDLRAKKGCVIDLIEEKEFIGACYELVETPIEDREDEKHYTVELPFLNHENKKMYLNGSVAEPYWSNEFYRHFTEEEIKEIDPRLWDFAAEVEGDI